MTGPSNTAWIISMLMHGGLVALLIFGPALRPTVQPVLPGGPIIEAVIIDPKLLDLAPLDEPAGPTRSEIERAERQRLEQEQADRDELARQEQERQDEQKRQEQIRVDNEKKEAERVKAAADVRKKEELEQAKKIEDARKEKERIAREEEVKKVQADKIERERVAAEEAGRKKEEELAAQKALEAKKKKEEQERIAAKKKADELAAKKIEEARLKKIADAKEAARKKKAAEELAAKLQREEEMRRMMGLEDQRNKAVDNGLMAQYIAQIAAKVERSWTRPPSAREDLSCSVRVTQIPGGDVVKVEIGECNGDAVVRNSIERAVNKASPLPEPADPTLFERNLVFIFEPK